MLKNNKSPHGTKRGGRALVTGRKRPSNRQERAANKLLGRRMLSGKEIQLTIDETGRQADATSELFKVFTEYRQS